MNGPTNGMTHELTLPPGCAREGTSPWRRLLALAQGWWRRRAAAARRRDEWRTLEGLDPATLRDLGLDRSELGSIQAELAGNAPATRRRVRRA